MIKPDEVLVEVHAVNGNELCEYVAVTLNEQRGWSLDEYDVYDFITKHKHNSTDSDIDSTLFELIIEQEDYCNNDNPNDYYYVVLSFIAEEFGGHFNINFLSSCAYM